jgi:hypothetical protein
MEFRSAKPHEKESRVAQTCRSLACLRPCPEGAYIPTKYGRTYAPPWFFDPAILVSAFEEAVDHAVQFDLLPDIQRRVHPTMRLHKAAQGTPKASC